MDGKLGNRDVVEGPTCKGAKIMKFLSTSTLINYDDDHSD